jgi:2-polyprenyl-3-methyl-5-hydroxy-6-metoxy-1,4-benzoquinol methylase
MARIATPERMQGSWYRQYGRMPIHAHRADAIQGRFTNRTARILIAGCGAGYTVAELTERGYTQVWGCDAAAWIINQGKAEMPQIASRLLVADCTVRSHLSAVRTAAGLTGSQRFALVITDDVLPCMESEAELQTLLSELRRITQAMGHVVTCTHPWLPGDLASRIPGTGLWWRTADEWKASINAASEWLWDCELGVIV